MANIEEVFEGWKEQTWAALASMCPEASSLMMGRGNKRKEHSPRQALLRIYGTLERIYATHAASVDALTTSAKSAVAIFKQNQKDEKKHSEEMRRVTWSAMRRFPLHVTMEPSRQRVVNLDLSDAKNQRVVKASFMRRGWDGTFLSEVQLASLRWDGSTLMWKETRFLWLVTKEALKQQEWLVFCMCEKRNAMLKRFFDNVGGDVLKMIFAFL